MTTFYVNVETLRPPREYSLAQVALAMRVAAWLHRGKLVLTQPPEGTR